MSAMLTLTEAKGDLELVCYVEWWGAQKIENGHIYRDEEENQGKSFILMMMMTK